MPKEPDLGHFYHLVTGVHKTCFLQKEFNTQLSKKSTQRHTFKVPTYTTNLSQREKIQVLNELCKRYLPQKETHGIPNGIPEFFHERHGVITVLIRIRF